MTKSSSNEGPHIQQQNGKTLYRSSSSLGRNKVCVHNMKLQTHLSDTRAQTNTCQASLKD